MNNYVLHYGILFVVVILLIINIIFTKSQSDQIKTVLSELKGGGLGLVEHIDKLILIQAALEEDRKVDSLILKDFGTYFEVFQAHGKETEAFVAIAKSDPSLVYYVDKEGIVYYDKIEYQLREELKVGYRLKFYQWLQTQ